MNLIGILKKTEKLAVDNSPLLLTAIGVAGTVATAVLAHRAALKSRDILEQNDAWIVAEERKAGHDLPQLHLTRKEIVKLVGKNYIPPAIVGSLTIGSIVCANRIGTKRAAALAAAYTISEQFNEEYRKQVVDKIGIQKEKEIRDDIAHRRMSQDPYCDSSVMVVNGSGDVPCFDLWSGRYFPSSADKIKKAVNEINYMVNHNGYASLSDFYRQLGLPETQESDMVGWTQDKLLDLELTAHLDDGLPCLGFQFLVHPVRWRNAT